jgi:hypothetical protein
MKKILSLGLMAGLALGVGIARADAAPKRPAATKTAQSHDAGACRSEIARRGIRRGPEGLAALRRCVSGGFDKI